MNKKCVKLSELMSCNTPYLKELFDGAEYPWQLLGLIGETAKKLCENMPEGFRKLSDDVIVGKDTVIYDSAVIEGPAGIGEKCIVRPGAFIRGAVITGTGCVIGNSTELKNCILLDGVQVPHYNYVGDSVLGYKAHMGAGAVTSNVKSDRTLVSVRAGDEVLETRLKKMGAILGDRVEVGCNSVLNPGTVIGADSNIYPLSSVRGTVPPRCILKSGKGTEIVEKQ